MHGKFKIKKITDLNSLTEKEEFPESDYATITVDNKFIQFEYVEGQAEAQPYPLNPGIYCIMASMSGLYLEPTSFTKDDILEDFLNTKEIEDRADCFFRNVHRYKEIGIDVAKRNMLLYGAPGTGKSTAISKVCNKYIQDEKTSVVIFPTEKIEAFQVKDFIKTFEYKNVERLILIMEDVGGSELEEVRRAADAGLLSLLDNQEKTFKIPTLIIATTNFPETLMGSLTNRPGRFDDKIKAGTPNKQARIKLAEFFLKRELDDSERKLLESSPANTLTPAHIKEAVIRTVIHEKSLYNSIQEVIKEIEEYNKGFSDKGSVGF